MSYQIKFYDDEIEIIRETKRIKDAWMLAEAGSIESLDLFSELRKLQVKVSAMMEHKLDGLPF